MNRRDAVKLLALAAATASVGAAAVPPPPAKKRVVGVLIYEGVEALDFCGPYEVFSLAHTHDDDAAGTMRFLFDVRIVAATAAPVVCRGGLTVVSANTFADCPRLDILVVPGGTGKEAVLRDKPLLAWVAKQAAGAELVTSVCTGSFILAEAGLLDGKRSATHQMSIKEMRAKYPKVTVVEGERVVEDGKVVTAAGVSSGLDMSLKVVEKLHGKGVAQMVAAIIEYPPPAAAAK